MAIRIQHPEHGYHNVFSQVDLEAHIKAGWSEIIEKSPKPIKPVEVVVEPLKPVEPIVAATPTYPCEVCGKVFTMKMHLGAHKRKHKG